MTIIKSEIEEHPFALLFQRMQLKLIIGSIPPQRFCNRKDEPNSLYPGDVNFYYGSRDNSFWPLVGEVFNISFEMTNTQNAIDQRKQFLTENFLGITDVVNKCTRLNGFAEDKKLQEIEYKNLEKLLADNPQINILIYTSDFIKQQVNKIFNVYHSSSGKTNKEFTVKIQDKIYCVKVLYSPSPNGLRNIGKGGKERRMKQYHEFLTN